MAKAKHDPLFELIHSLNKTEKRHFRLFVNKSRSSDDVKFIKLFDAMDTLKLYDDQKILAKVPSIKKAQLSNQKANLYKQILSSLRQYHLHQNIDIQLRELLDHAKVLYNKGFYQQALKMLDRTKTVARQQKQFTMVLEVLEFEKLIEAQFITRSGEHRAATLTQEVNEITQIISSGHTLSNLTLHLYSLFLQRGYAKNEEEFRSIEHFFKEKLPKVDVQNLKFYEALYYHQAHVWYNKIVQHFPNAYRHSLAWVNLFKADENMAQKQSVHFIKGYGNLLGALFQLQYYSKFCEVLEEVEVLSRNEKIVQDLNTEILIFKFFYISKINKYFMEGNFSDGVAFIPEVLNKLDQYKSKIDPERVLIFYYKIASLYFGNAQYRKAIYYLNLIINFKDVQLREDIHCFARILNLIAHFEDGQDYMLEYQIKSTFQFIGRMNDQQAVQKEIIHFLKKTGKITPDQLKDELSQVYERLLQLNDNLYERRPFFYLDILSYLESRIQNRPVQEIIKEKFKKLR